MALGGWGRIVLGSLAILGFAGFCVVWWTSETADSYVMGHPSEFVSLALRRSPVALIFPLLAAIPCAAAVVPVVRNRFLVYTRTRRNLSRSLTQVYLVTAGVTFVVFALLMGIYVGGAAVSAAQSPQLYDPSAVSYAADEATTFAQLIGVGGDGLYYGFLITWFGVNAAAYATLAVTGVLVVRQAVIGLLLPWVVFVATGFGMAVVGLEAFSPLTVAPFNLTQLPMWMPLVTCGVVVTLAVASAVVTVRNADRLSAVA